jgi:hypothetical protein
MQDGAVETAPLVLVIHLNREGDERLRQQGQKV